jgi:hypothetical protein
MTYADAGSVARVTDAASVGEFRQDTPLNEFTASMLARGGDASRGTVARRFDVFRATHQNPRAINMNTRTVHFDSPDGPGRETSQSYAT